MEAGRATTAQEADSATPRKKKPSDEAARKRDARERGLSPAAPPEGPGKDAALAECAAACCVLCACLPVAVLCCAARAPIRATRRCWRWRRGRRPQRRLAPGGSSSFSDAEIGDYRRSRTRAMADESGRPRTSPPAAPTQQPPSRDRRR